VNQTEIDHAELDSTQVSPAVARFFSLAFAVMLFAVPVSQAVVELSREQEPQALALFQPFATGLRSAATADWSDVWVAWREGVKPETLHSYEAALENASVFKSFFQPRIQEVLTGVLGTGNDQVVLGRSGWIFYQPGLEYVVRPSIIDQANLDLAARKMVDKGLDASPQPDPRPALLQLDRDCRESGIRLVVFPAPDKVMLQPAQLYRSVQAADGLPVGNNVGYSRLVEEMRADGVDWFDPTPQSVRATDIRYLAQDTHWTPGFMDTIAGDLAAHIRQTGALAESAPIPLRVVEQQVARVGDLVDMLKLTARQSIFRPETVTIQRIVDERSGQSIEPDSKADVLLLGDSFTNIYSRREMGWGAGAGFGEHLAYHLRRPIDVIAFNGGGATRVRAELARQDNAERLGHKKVIVYEFAIRSLLGESWKPIPMITPIPATTVAMMPGVASIPAVSRRTPREQVARKDGQHAPQTVEGRSAKSAVTTVDKPVEGSRDRVSAGPAGDLAIVGRIIQTSKVPAPGTAPYKDCLTFVKVRVESVESGSYDGGEMLVVMWAMKDNRWLPAASYGVGDRLRMTVIPFSQAATEIRGMQRADDTEDYTLRPFYVLRETRE
jgi:hypothetical protein